MDNKLSHSAVSSGYLARSKPDVINTSVMNSSSEQILKPGDDKFANCVFSRHSDLSVPDKSVCISWKFIESCFHNIFRPSWLSRSHESLVFNSVYSTEVSTLSNQNHVSGAAAAAYTNQRSTDSSTNGNVSRDFNDILSQSNQFPPLHSSHSQYFNSHHLGSNHRHRPSLALDSNENILLSSSISTNESALASANQAKARAVTLQTSLGEGRKALTTNDNYLHMNGGPNGMGPVVMGVASNATLNQRTNSTSNLQMHSSTLEKQKLDRSQSTAHLKYGANAASAFDLHMFPSSSASTSQDHRSIRAHRTYMYGTSRPMRQQPNASTGANQSVQSLFMSNVSSSSPLVMNSNGGVSMSNFTPSMQYHASQAQMSNAHAPLPLSNSSSTPGGAAHMMMAVAIQPPRIVNTLRMHVLEMKGAPSGKKQRIYCQICVKGHELGQTTAKQKLDILFWGELFNFTPDELRSLQPIDSITIRIFKEGETKKKKKDSGNTCLGRVTLSVKDISGDWHETWYHVEDKAKSCEDNCTLRVRAVYHTVEVLDHRCYAELLEFLKEDSLLLYKVVEGAILLKEKEDFSTSLIQVLHFCDKIDVFFADVIEYELKKETNPRMVFRGNSLATKSMEAYLKFIGSNYLAETLRETIQEIYRRDECYEIDAQKLTPSLSPNPSAAVLEQQKRKIAEQQDKFKKLCSHIWTIIQKSIDTFPREMQRVFAKIKERLSPKWTSEVIDNIITGSVFLRFLCPAIMTPNFFGLHNAYPPENTVRTLKLVAKLLQALANNTLLGEKESYMTFMNEFMAEEFPNMRKFLDDISTNTSVHPFHVRGENAVSKQVIDVPKECAIIHRMLLKIKDSSQLPHPHQSSRSASTSFMAPQSSSSTASIASLSKSGKSLSQIIHQITASLRQPNTSTAFMYNSAGAAATPNNVAMMRSYNPSPQPMSLQHQMAAISSTPTNYAPQGVVMQQQQQLSSASNVPQQYPLFAAQPVRQASVDSQMRLDSQNQYPQQLGYPNVSGGQDPMRIKAPTDIVQSLDNTYYNQPCALLHNTSHHVNSTLPRSTKIHPSASSALPNKATVGNIPGFSMPPPPNYPPPPPGGDCEENYENMEFLKLSSRQQQQHQSPHKKNSASSTTSSNMNPGSSDQIANPTAPFHPAMPEQAQRVRLNHSQSSSTVNLQSIEQSRPQQQQPLPSRQSDFKPKSKLGISSLTSQPQQMHGSKMQSPSGANHPGIYDAADQHYNVSSQGAPTASIEYKAVSRAANRTPTSEVPSLTMSMQYANTESINQHSSIGSREEMRTPTAKSPSTVPVQIIPESRSFRSHTPTANNEQRQTSSHGDVMTLANPIYDVYHGTESVQQQQQQPYNTVLPGEEFAMRRSDSVSSDGAISQLSEVESSNMVRVQSDSSFPSELDIRDNSVHSGGHSQTSHTTSHRNHHHHQKKHRSRKQRRFSADSNSLQLPSSSAAESGARTKNRRRGKTLTSGAESGWGNASEGGDEESASRGESGADDFGNGGDSLENVFVPQSTLDCVMPSMSFKRQHNNNNSSRGPPVSPPPHPDKGNAHSSGEGSTTSQRDPEDNTRDSNADDDRSSSASQQSFVSTVKEGSGDNNSNSTDLSTMAGVYSSDLAPSPSHKNNNNSSGGSSGCSSSVTDRKRHGGGGAGRGGSRTPVVKSAHEYESELSCMQTKLREVTLRLEEKEAQSEQEKKALEAKKHAMQEDNSRLSQQNQELRSQLEKLSFELNERERLITNKDEKITKLLKSNQKMLETWNRAKQSSVNSSNAQDTPVAEDQSSSSSSAVNGVAFNTRKGSAENVSRMRDSSTNRRLSAQPNGHPGGEVVRMSKPSIPIVQSSTPL